MTTQAQTAGPVNTVLMASLAGLVVSLGVALAMLMGQGHAAFNTGSDGVSWGLPVAAYVFFAITSTGLTLVASLAMVFGVKAFYPVAKRCVLLAGASLIGGMACLALEVGHVFRMAWALPFSFQIVSAMWWMGVLYALDLVFMALKFQRVNAGDWDSPASRFYGVASMVFAVAATATLGLVFGMMAMRPFWFGDLIPISFIVMGAVSGVAIATLATYVAYGSQNNMPEKVQELVTGVLPKVFAAVLVFALLMIATRTITGLWSNADGLEAFDWMVASPWFWIEIVALALACYILLSPGLRATANMQVAASVLALVALFISRYEYVVGGQVVPLFKGAWVPQFIDYTPSLTEWMLALLALSLTFGIYALGEKMFNLGAAPEKS